MYDTTVSCEREISLVWINGMQELNGAKFLLKIKQIEKL